LPGIGGLFGDGFPKLKSTTGGVKTGLKGVFTKILLIVSTTFCCPAAFAEILKA
jgi:hypothetical protein